MKRTIALTVSLFVSGVLSAGQIVPGILTSREEVATLPMMGNAWEAMKAEADRAPQPPELADQEDRENVRVLARALVYARTGDESYRRKVIDGCMAAIGTEQGGRTLALGRELAAYVIAADLVVLPAEEDERFRAWLRTTLTEVLDGRTLISTHEDRPNNWGTHAGASRVAVAVYLGDTAQVERCARVFQGWLGDRTMYTGFKFGDLSWQSNPAQPRGVNPLGATIQGHDVDGVLPDDQRRGGDFTWPPPKENYVYEALQGALLQAIILYRRGYPVWDWQNRALCRAFRWLHGPCAFPAVGDDTWQPWVINFYYGAVFPAVSPSQPGKNIGFTDWLYGQPLDVELHATRKKVK